MNPDLAKKMDNTIFEINPRQIDWNLLWNKDLKKLPKLQCNEAWNKIAPQFDRWMETDDYPGIFVDKIHLSPDYRILDIGCGNGAVSIPVAKKVRHVTVLDISDKMLQFVKEKACNEGLSNISYLQDSWQNTDIKNLEKFDVVIASRSLGGVPDIKNELKKIDEVAKKYVYITLWGVNARGLEKKLHEVIGRQFPQHPDYNYVVNILHQMGIYANVEMLDCKNQPVYANLKEVVDLFKWRINDLTLKEESLIRNYLEQEMITDDNGMLKYPYDKSDWVMIWWKK